MPWSQSSQNGRGISDSLGAQTSAATKRAPSASASPFDGHGTERYKGGLGSGRLWCMAALGLIEGTRCSLHKVGSGDDAR